MITKQIKVHNLSAEAFKPYGQVINVPSRTPDTSDDVLSWWGKEAGLPAAGPVGIGIMQVRRREFIVPKFERHVKTAELLVPLKGPSILAVARGAASQVGLEQADAYFIVPGQAVVFHPGTWHWLPFPLEEDAAFIVAFREDTPQDDLEFLELEKNIGYAYQIIL